MEVCLSPMNNKGSDDKERDTKNGSFSQEMSTVEQHTSGGSDNEYPEASLYKCLHNVLHR